MTTFAPFDIRRKFATYGKTLRQKFTGYNDNEDVFAQSPSIDISPFNTGHQDAPEPVQAMLDAGTEQRKSGQTLKKSMKESFAGSVPDKGSAKSLHVAAKGKRKRLEPPIFSKTFASTDFGVPSSDEEVPITRRTKKHASPKKVSQMSLLPTAASSTVFDEPSSVENIPVAKPNHSRASPKRMSQTSTPSTPVSTKTISSVFDVPSSDEDVQMSPTGKSRRMTPQRATAKFPRIGPSLKSPKMDKNVVNGIVSPVSTRPSTPDQAKVVARRAAPKAYGRDSTRPLESRLPPKGYSDQKRDRALSDRHEEHYRAEDRRKRTKAEVVLSRGNMARSETQGRPSKARNSPSRIDMRVGAGPEPDTTAMSRKPGRAVYGGSQQSHSKRSNSDTDNLPQTNRRESQKGTFERPRTELARPPIHGKQMETDNTRKKHESTTYVSKSLTKPAQHLQSEDSTALTMKVSESRPSDPSTEKVEPVENSKKVSWSSTSTSAWDRLLDVELTDKLSDGKEHKLDLGEAAPAILAVEQTSLQEIMSPDDTPRKKRRLIDALMIEPDPSSESSDSEEGDLDLSYGMSSSSTADVSRQQHPTDERAFSELLIAGQQPTLSLKTFSTKASADNLPNGSKTYARQRSYLTDDMLEDSPSSQTGLAVDSVGFAQSGARGSRGLGSSFNRVVDDTIAEEVLDGANGSLRSIHELREAGANKRFLDEMESLLEDIEDRGAKSLSRRRLGLLELASKFDDTNFAQRFANSNLEHRLFADLKDELDVVVGSCLAFIVAAILGESVTGYSLPLIVDGGAVSMLSRLLFIDKDLKSIGRDRKTNMSKVAQSILLTFRDKIERSPAWSSLSQQSVSPLMLALRSIDALVRRCRENGDVREILPEDTVSKLLELLSSFSTWSSEAKPSESERVELELIVSILESYAVGSTSKFRTFESAADVVAGIFPLVCRWYDDDYQAIQHLVLRLYVAISTNNSAVCAALAKAPLLESMVTTLESKYSLLAVSVDTLEEDVRVPAVDLVTLITGFLTCLAESSDAAGAFEQHEGNLISRIVRLFLGWRTKNPDVSVSSSDRMVCT
jgi:Wings apart-like protein regulation of heterochromatin